MEAEGLVRPLASTLALVQVFPDPILLGMVRLFFGAPGTPPIIDSWNADWVPFTVGNIPWFVPIDRSHVRQSSPTRAVVEQQ